jgi:hypothetical protein
MPQPISNSQTRDIEAPIEALDATEAWARAEGHLT